MRTKHQIIVACFFFLVCSALIAEQPDRGQWGEWHTRNMVSDVTGLPDSFDPETGENIKWSVPLGTHTHSSPVVTGGRVLIGTNNGQPRDAKQQGDRGVLMCLDEKDGRLHWQLVVPKLDGLRLSDWPKTGITSSATVDDDRVYIVTNRGEVMCLDLKPPANSPVIIWRFDIRKQLGVHQHDAAHCSVLVDESFVYACTSNGVSDSHRELVAPDAPSLIALDKKTGRLVARDGEHMGQNTIHCTWSSPAMGRVGDRRLLFFGGGDGVCYAFEALQPAASKGAVQTLKRVWRFDCDPDAPKENIIRYQDNRRVGPSNITGMPVFYKDRVYVTAGGDLWHGKPKCWLKCIDATGTGDITRKGERWTYPLVRHCMSTPSIANGLVFITDCGRMVHCVDAETGKPYWTHKTVGEIWASTLVADGKVFVASRRGDFWVFAASREKKLLSRIELGPISSTPTTANGVLYVATMDRLYAIARK